MITSEVMPNKWKVCDEKYNNNASLLLGIKKNRFLYFLLVHLNALTCWGLVSLLHGPAFSAQHGTSGDCKNLLKSPKISFLNQRKKIQRILVRSLEKNLKASNDRQT